MIDPMGTLSTGLFALAGGIASSRPRPVVPPDRARDPARVPESHQWPIPQSPSAIPLRILPLAPVATPISPVAVAARTRRNARAPGIGQGALFDG